MSMHSRMDWNIMQCTLPRWVSENNYFEDTNTHTHTQETRIKFQFPYIHYSYFGQNCNQICKCKNSARCRKNDGYCICNAGWMGAHCEDVCPEGLFGLANKFTAFM